jgi:predicted regulator of amino acid metabolism with ACT domain
MTDKSPSSQMDLLPASLKDKANKITRQINQDRSTIDDTIDYILKNVSLHQVIMLLLVSQLILSILL